MSAADYDDCGFFVVRAPLLATTMWARWREAGDVQALRAFVQAQVERPEVREAIGVASPSLLQGLASWIDKPLSDDGQKVERALVRYLSRMATRPTPFGLFAGCGLGTLGDVTELRTTGPAGHARHTRLDNDYLDHLGRALTNDSAARRTLRFRPNTSLYELGGKIRYVEPQQSARGRTYNLVALDANEFVMLAVERAAEGAIPGEIAEALAEADPDVTVAEAHEFVDSLIDSDILVSDLEPTVTGREPVHPMIEALVRHEATANAGRVLADVQRSLEAIDAELPFRPQQARYAEVREQLTGLCEDVDPRHLLQVDMRLGLDAATLDADVLPELLDAATLLAQCCPEPEEHLMRQFCQQFEERYERREVPLLEVLDEDCGIGYAKLRPEGNDPEPMLTGINVSRPPPWPVGRTWGAFEEMLMHKLEAMAPGDREIELSADDFASVPRRATGLPASCALNVTFAAAGADALRRGDYQAHLHLVDGPSGANWLGRFCHGDPDLQPWIERAIAQEEALYPDAVFAEIVHLPEGRHANVLLRPLLRAYEIPYLGRSGADDEQLLPPDDLVVTVWDGRLVLKSKRLQREVIPRLTSAHGFPNPTNIGVYRFLGALQTAGRSVRTTWSWGALDAKSTFLPRVRLGRVVLSLARWALKPHHLAPLRVGTAQARWDAVQALRRALDLPRWVCIADADNLLSVDLDNELSVESAAHLLKSRAVANLVELFPTPDQAVVEGPEGPVTHELIIPVVRKPQPPAPEHTPWLHPTSASASDVQRVFPPGSPWLYLKLYASPRSCDLALLELGPKIRELVGDGVVDRWFFLRMADTTGWHLRLRLHGDAARLSADALPQLRALIEPMLEDSVVWKMQLDTYQREVEHWGGAAGVLLAEQFLAHDSEAALAILERHAEDPSALAQARWQLALRGVDGLWAGVGLDLRARQELAAACRAGFEREFQGGRPLEKELGSRFRVVRKDIERVLGDAPAWPKGSAALAVRDEALAPVFEQLRALDRRGELMRPLDDLAPRLAHLHVNRMLRSMLREQELVIMDFLGRHYRSALARARKNRS